jgi:hypothetical protein
MLQPLLSLAPSPPWGLPPNTSPVVSGEELKEEEKEREEKRGKERGRRRGRLC